MNNLTYCLLMQGLPYDSLISRIVDYRYRQAFPTMNQAFLNFAALKDFVNRENDRVDLSAICRDGDKRFYLYSAEIEDCSDLHVLKSFVFLRSEKENLQNYEADPYRFWSRLSSEIIERSLSGRNFLAWLQDYDINIFYMATRGRKRFQEVYVSIGKEGLLLRN